MYPKFIRLAHEYRDLWIGSKSEGFVKSKFSPPLAGGLYVFPTSGGLYTFSPLAGGSYTSTLPRREGIKGRGKESYLHTQCEKESDELLYRHNTWIMMNVLDIQDPFTYALRTQNESYPSTL
jgi:hypothetical protein